MANPSLFQELRSRKVFRAAAAYIVVAWLVLQIVDVVAPMLELPGWVGKFVLLLLIAGLPIAIFFAWAFELTPEGVRRDTGSSAVPAQLKTEGKGTAATVYDGKSIAVLPLENLSGDSGNQPFALGVHDDLISQISKIGSIKTISRTSVMQYRETTKTIPQIATELGVATVLEGGVQKAGDRVHVNVQLIDAATDHHLWADSYDRQLTAENIFAIQEEIATSVAEALHATLSPEQIDRLASVPTKSMAALEEYFAGRQNLATRTVHALEKAEAHFEQAIELDPDFALAYVGLADAVVLQNVYGNLPEVEMLARAEPVVNKALALDKNLGEAYASLGALNDHIKAYEKSEAAYKHAIELNPNYAPAYGWYATLLIDGFDRVMEGFAMTAKAAELDPLSCTINTNLGVMHDVLGDFDAALKQYYRVIEIDPTYAVVYPLMGFVYWEGYGDLVAAQPWFVQGIERSPASPNYPAYIGLLYLDLGDGKKAEQWIDKAIELGATTYRPNVAKALLALYRGDDEASAAYAAKAMEYRPNVWWGWAALAQLRNEDLSANRTEQALERYEREFPTLADSSEFQVNRTNFRVAIDYALVLARSGKQQRANALVDRCMKFIKTIPRMGQEGYWISDVAIYALRGDTQAALTALRDAIDQGWRVNWWYFLKHDPNFDAIREEPEYRNMVQELQSDMAEQLSRL